MPGETPNPADATKAAFDEVNNVDNAAKFQKARYHVPEGMFAPKASYGVAEGSFDDKAAVDAARNVVDGPYSGAPIDAVAASDLSAEPAPVLDGVHPVEYSGKSNDETAVDKAEGTGMLNAPDASGLTGDQMTASVEAAAVREPLVPGNEADRQMGIAAADRANRDAAGLPPRTPDLQ